MESLSKGSPTTAEAREEISTSDQNPVHPTRATSTAEAREEISKLDQNPVHPTRATGTITSRTRWLGKILPALHLLWLAPIILLLVLNLKKYVVGPSFACLQHNCLINPYASNVSQVTSHLAYVDHNVLGSLQLVAKALEVWFMFIAGSLIYDLSMLLARRGDGLPLGYLFTHKEFAEIKSFGKSFWTAAVPGDKKIGGDGREDGDKSTTSRLTLYAFAMLVAMLAILVNLMGPSTAVLLLPTLERVRIHNQNSSVFIGLDAGDAPSILQASIYIGSINVSCYDCNPVFFETLDSMVADAISSGSITIQTYSNIEYTINTTNFTASLTWTPSRQTIIGLASDMLQYQFSTSNNLSSTIELLPNTNDTTTPSLYKTYRSSIDAQVQRDGPVVGFLSQCMLGNTSVIPIANDKLVRCYTSWPNNALFLPGPIYPYSNPDEEISTKCIRVGSGWVGARNDYAQFYISNLRSKASNTTEADSEEFDTASVNIYSVASAIFLNASTSYCSTPINNQSNPTCDWDKLFSETPSPQYRNYSLNQQLIEYVYPNTTAKYEYPSNDAYGFPGPYTTNWCWSVAFLSFGTYLVDLASISGLNPISGVPTNNNLATLSSVNSISPAADPIYVHPGWMLLSWSVNNSGVVDPSTGGEVVSDLFEVMLESTNWLLRDAVHAAIMANSLALITYDQYYDNTTSANTTLNPILTAYTTAEAWSYGLSSATSKLGFAVGILGCVMVCFAVAVGISTRTTKRELLGLFTTTITQKPPENLVGVAEKQVEKVRFMIRNDENAEFEFPANRGTV
ncbi:hypothetical protein N431DRAFT_430632 [Stipitochalara longipes BDJ]|nr:hypothetical protein N431DRAFT_430632 [Stipitochalara longipes BDJ]